MNILPNGSSLYGNYRTRTFVDIFPKVTDFTHGYTYSEFPLAFLDIKKLNLIYYLLYARYGNSSIASSDENQFKYKLYSTVFMYGPTWEKRLEIQEKLRNLTDDEILKGSTAIYNSAINPSAAPTTQTLDELNYINSQNTTKHKKSKLEGYAILENLLKTDVTEEFISKFKKLFITIVEPELPLWYIGEE